ncbi:MAG: hypothetical protein KDA59_26345, partial [Planctomycetales bacterium]|nr:hypothetical protein [Planctomycetales bacterium]
MTAFRSTFSRRQMLRDSGLGFGYLALASMLNDEAVSGRVRAADDVGLDASATNNPLAPRDPHFAPRAKRVIFLFM